MDEVNLKDNLAPIVLFVYNRPIHTEKTISFLSKNNLADKSKLFIFCDGPKPNKNEQDKIYQVFKLVEKYKSSFSEVNIIRSIENKGCANSIIKGLNYIFRIYTNAIIVEDDIITSKWFLTYMNNGLKLFENNSKIASIAGFIEPINTKMDETYLLTKGTSWGWATWKRVWVNINWDSELLYKNIMQIKDLTLYNFGGIDFEKMLINQIEKKIDSWAIRFYTSCYLSNSYHITPPLSLSKNIGLDNSGEHCGPDVFLDKIKLTDKMILPTKSNEDLSYLVHSLLLEERKKASRKQNIAYYRKRVREIKIVELPRIIKRKLNL